MYRKELISKDFRRVAGTPNKLIKLHLHKLYVGIHIIRTILVHESNEFP